MQPVLFDTSAYITVLRMKRDASRSLRQIAPGAAVWLSSVVLEELYAGASGKALRAVERLERDFDKARRILVPNLKDWTHTGKLLARLTAKYDYERIGQGRLTNDALIASSAGRLGITVITANPRDFERLAEFRPFQWRVADFAPQVAASTLNFEPRSSLSPAFETQHTRRLRTRPLFESSAANHVTL